MRSLWYDPDGNPIAAADADVLLRNDLARRVAQTCITTERGEIKISTVFLVLDHSHGTTGPPVLWETMIFGGSMDEYQWRYTSRAAAEAGHAEAVTAVRSELDLEGIAVVAEDTFAPGSPPKDGASN
jgi:hypothetical protein